MPFIIGKKYMMGFIQDSNFDSCGTDIDSQSVMNRIAHMLKMPFLRNCPVTSQLLPKSAINRLQRWILTLMNYFLTVRAINALTC